LPNPLPLLQILYQSNFLTFYQFTINHILTHLFMKKSIIFSAFAAAAMFVSSAAFAQVDLVSGIGFVGKGDVQLALELNNKALQDAVKDLALEFTIESKVVTEVTWTCTNSNNENISYKDRQTTVTVQGVANAVERVKNQVTGFNLNGFIGEPKIKTQESGNQLNACGGGPWSLTTPAGEPEFVSSEGGLYVSLSGGTPVLL
jgi:hypothetical protein